MDRVSGQPLFSSLDKYDSGTGWPSFIKPLEPENLIAKADTSLGMDRVEIRGKKADSHLGHVFNDGPAPTGLRFLLILHLCDLYRLKILKKKATGDIFEK